ncbi:adaptin N terminal region-domain-containing protein [Epithele typhae]|uniref:adaptin N terminal region-domain-containing protein n=1 Tax=Epithele typhae TaxID=378194 RepID=UPI00200737B3|nr:adaptin N terminal region-domain-containing protein [Epithele typhae]KAH9945480.1 adaptin N terminal region-domain-containing protein [Epithele typhae]
MAALNLNAITENASRLGMRLQETLSEHTRDLSIRGSGAAYLDNTEDKVKNIAKQLDSNSDREKLDAMKRLIGLISKGRNVSEFFAQVVKNVASHNLEIRKLVYIYLLRYAEQEPDLALLSINTFQKDLSDANPLIRAMALRVLSGIKVPMIASIVMLAIKKCAADISPYVRKAAALAIPKLYQLDSSRQGELIQVISTLLKDQSPLSLGSVAIAFDAVCPTRLDLLHRHYRRLCRTLVDMDEWGQVDLINLLVRYARVMLPRPATDGPSAELDPDLRLLVSSTESLFQSNNPAVVLAVARVVYYLAPAAELPKTVPPLLRLLHVSTEVERVVLANLAITSLSISEVLSKSYTRFLVRADDPQQVKKDKIRLLRAVANAETYPALLREFICYADDPDDELVADSIQAIGYVARAVPESTQQCLTALMSFIQSKHDVIVTNAVLVLKSLVQIRLQQQQDAIAYGAFPSQSFSPLEIIARLARRLDEIRHPKARACVLWLVGQYAASPENAANGIAHAGPEGLVPWAPDVLRKAAKSFATETPLVKLQSVTLAAKLLVLSPAARPVLLLARYVFSLARYDTDYDVRDRGRALSALLAGVAGDLYATETGDDWSRHEDVAGVVLRREQVKMVLFAGKTSPAEEAPVDEDDRGRFGSLAAITGRWAGGDNYLPDWLEEGVDPALRESEADRLPPAPFAAPQSAAAAVRSMSSASGRASPVVLTPGGVSPAGSVTKQEGKAAYLDLDKFYEDAGEESEEEDDDDDDDDDDEEDAEEDGDGDGDDDSGEEAESSEEEDDSEDGENTALVPTTTG